MENEKLKNLSIEQLQKKKKFGAILLIILIAAVILDCAAAIYNLIIGDGLNIYLITPAIACFVIAIPMYIGFKKIEEELRNRKES